MTKGSVMNARSAPIQHQRLEVRIQTQRRVVALHADHGTGAASRHAFVPHAPDDEGLHPPHERPPHRREQQRVEAEPVADDVRQAHHPLPDQYVGQDVRKRRPPHAVVPSTETQTSEREPTVISPKWPSRRVGLSFDSVTWGSWTASPGGYRRDSPRLALEAEDAAAPQRALIRGRPARHPNDPCTCFRHLEL
jgi:hypothetical protein